MLLPINRVRIMIDLHGRIRSSELMSLPIGENVTLAGFVQRKREQGQLTFIILRDRDGLVQLVIKDPDLIKKAKDITEESVIAVKGILQTSKSRNFQREVKVQELEILSLSDVPLPIEFLNPEVHTSLDKRLDYRWIDLRNPRNLLIFRILSDFVNISRQYFLRKGLIEIFTPKILAYPSEGGGEELEISYFGRKAYLAQSPQFYKQMAQAAGFEGVFEIAPVFRANPSHTTRHDTEFTSLDVEISYVDYLDLIEFEEDWLVTTFRSLADKYGDEVKRYFDLEMVVPRKPFPRITYSEALEICGSERLGTAEEKALGKYILETYDHHFVYVLDYPVSERPFYHRRKDPQTTESFDLLFKGLEITTGSTREHRYEILKEQAKEFNLDLAKLEFYLDFFRWGCPPHAGFGLSPTRVVMKLLDLPNVKETTFVPRDPDRLIP